MLKARYQGSRKLLYTPEAYAAIVAAEAVEALALANATRDYTEEFGTAPAWA